MFSTDASPGRRSYRSTTSIWRISRQPPSCPAPGVPVELDLISTPGAASMPQDKRVYEFGAFHIDAAERLLFRGDELIPLTPKVADTLLVLLSNAGRIVGKDELMKTVWPDAFVDEGGLARNISTLRKALDDGDKIQFIETLPKRGYRFVAPLRVDEAEPAGTDPTPAAGRTSRAIPHAVWIAAALLAILAATAYYRHRSASAAQRFSSLIVLPLENLSGDPAQDHIADTMTEELINRSEERRV